MKTFALRFLFGLIVASALALTGWAQTKPGAIKAVKVQGEVFKLTPDGQSTKLAEGALLTESDTVVTGKASSVVLVFMNGSSIKLAADSKLAIAEFKMDPLDESINVAQLVKEPSVSKTKLDLAYGEMVGDVKHLNRDGGSTFEIKTPVGAAGIRGTTFRIVFRPSGDGKAFNFTLSTAEGVVLFQGSGQAGSGVNVPKDKEVVVTAQVDPTTNQVTSLQVSDVQPISPAIIQIITDAINNSITPATGSVNFTISEQTAPAKVPAGSGDGTNPGLNTNTVPRTTSGDGGGGT